MKQLVFKLGAVVYTKCTCTLQDESNLNENFIINNIIGVDTSVKIKLFNWLTKYLPYTLNELIFFAINNGLCIYIYSESGTLLTSHGSCGGALGDFNWDFNNDFFK